MKNELVLDRADFLERNRAALAHEMRAASIADPVGIVADLRDFHGRQIALAVGMNEKRIDEEIAEYEGVRIPTLITVIDWETAEAMMPKTSPSASGNLKAAKMLCNATGQKLAIAIMGKGNLYELLDLNQ